jgi:periplasmic protein TonB
MAAVHGLEAPLQGAVATHMPGAAEFWSGLDQRSRVLYASVAASLLLHAVLLSVHFRFPDEMRWRSDSPALDVILVNAKTQQRPARTEALAQANLDGGGDTDQARRAKSPLPVIDPRRPGRDLAQAERRVRELETRQRQLLAQSRVPAPGVAAGDERRAPSDEATPRIAGRDLADLSLAAMRLQAEIDRNLAAYQKRPRVKNLGASAVEYRYAHYEEDWRRKVERIGTLNYPSGSRGRLYGDLQLTVTIKPNGDVHSIELLRSSGIEALDQAAFKIVKMASPYAVFPPDIRREVDLLAITRTWFFGRGDTLWTK